MKQSLERFLVMGVREIIRLSKVGLIGAMLLYGGTAAASETWRLGSMMPPDSAEGKGYAKFAELVDKYTDGAVDIRVYPSSQLGKMNAMVEQLSAGVIQIVGSNAAFLSKWVPDIKFMTAPFLFADSDHWKRFMNTDLVNGWFKKVEDEVGIMVLGSIPDFPRGTYRVLVTKKPVNSLTDVKGLKIRQFANELVVDVWQHLGAEVRVMGWNEVYDGLNRGIVEAVTSPAELVESMRFYEVAPNIVRTNEYPQGIAFMVNKQAFEALPAKTQEGIRRAHVEASAYEVEILKAGLDESLGRIKAKGATYSESMDVSAFMKKAEEFYEAREKEGKLPKGFLAAVKATRNP
ncbi:MAG: TRAP transporter substrate-binding protein [Rhodospirillales bacterium]|nr:TRAP transporter substrate-binding protein [Rhodospirillales bacterium]